MSLKKQLVIRNHGTYNIGKLIILAKDVPIRRFKVNDILSILKAFLWEENEKVITPFQVLKNPNKYPLHMNKIKNVDMQYPIILFNNCSTSMSLHRSDNFDIHIPKGYDVLDGLHRLCNAIINKRKTIKVKVIPWSLLQIAKTKEFKFN